MAGRRLSTVVAAVRHGTLTERLILPPQLSKLGVAGQGWQASTAVRQSLIPGAGNGRFAEEIVAPNVRVSVKPIVPMESLESLRAVKHDGMRQRAAAYYQYSGSPVYAVCLFTAATITFASEGDLEKYVCLAEVEGGYSRGQVLEVFEHFVWSQDGERAFLNVSTKAPATNCSAWRSDYAILMAVCGLQCCMEQNCTWSMNHADGSERGLNIAFSEAPAEDGAPSSICSAAAAAAGILLRSS